MFFQEYFYVFDIGGGGNLQKVQQRGVYDLNYILKYIHKILSNVIYFLKSSLSIFANYIQKYFQK